MKKVTPGEMQRLNTAIPAVPAADQKALGALDGDLAGFPNGRRPGDDVTDIELRVAMGRLCYPLTVGGSEVDLGLCKPEDAPVGNVPFTDGAPVSAQDFDTTFPYLRTPIAGLGRFPDRGRPVRHEENHHEDSISDDSSPGGAGSRRLLRRLRQRRFFA